MERSPLQVRTTSNKDNIRYNQTPTHKQKDTEYRHQDENDFPHSSKKRQPTTPLTPSRHEHKVIKKPNNRPSMEAFLGPSPIIEDSASKENECKHPLLSEYFVSDTGSPLANRNVSLGSDRKVLALSGLFKSSEITLQQCLIISQRENIRMKKDLEFAELERRFMLEG